MPFRIAIKQNGLEHGYDYLLNISHPRSPHYGKLWTPERVREVFAPSQSSIDSVRNWLLDSNVRDITEERGWFDFRTTIRHAEELFGSEYYEHEDDRSGAVRVGCHQYVCSGHLFISCSRLTCSVITYPSTSPSRSITSLLVSLCQLR